MNKFYLLSFLLLLISGIAMGQQDNGRLVDVDYKSADINAVTSDLKAKTGFTFYYDVTQFDSLRITLSVSQKPLVYILDKAFENTPFHYAITAEREVILTKTVVINTALVPGLFPDETIASTKASINTKTINSDQKVVAEANNENRLYEIGQRTNTVKQGNVTLTGYIRNERSGQALGGSTVYDPAIGARVAADQFGFYSIVLPYGRHTLIIKGLGNSEGQRQVMLYAGGKLNIGLVEQINLLKEVNISAEKKANVKSVEMGVNRLDIKNIRAIPTAFGEADILKAILTLPGVQTVGEATTGFNVRGGSADQNLILLNDATIYNPAHFFGFFSAFNPDIVKGVELYKSTIPEKYGGRLASVLDVTDREGNKKKFTGSAGIGLLTSRFNIEGPIVKDKTSFIFGGRTTYSDWLLNLLPQAYKNSSASFYDFNLDITHQINNKNSITFTGYLSKDKFRLNSDTAYSYGNKNANIKWKHNFNNKLFGTFLVGLDDYDYDVTSTANPVNAYKLNFGIRQTNFKTDFTYYLNSKNTIDFGLSAIYYSLNPGNNQPEGSQSLLVPDVVPGEHALENALYLGDKFDITPKFSVSAGIRYSLYAYLGPQTVDTYQPNQPKSSTTVLDSTTYGKNKVINTYQGPEVRVSARYNLTDDMSVKASYNTLRQFIHLLTNTTAISPTDVYKLSDPNIKPQFGQQVSLGLYRNFQKNVIETSVEVYYKKISNYLDYKSGATLILNDNIERDVVNTQGKAYGVEFLLKKNAGIINGWVSYTYSRTFLRQDDPNAGEIINNGRWYPANYDKPHAFNFTGNFRFSQRFSVSADMMYSTGRPITYPITEYYYEGAVRVLYSDRNAYRIPDYFRTDLSMNIDGNHKVHQRFHNSWTIGVYNLTGHANAYSTFFTNQGGAVNSYKLSIFASPIPFINYNVRF